jgi:hypothetical protein
MKSSDKQIEGGLLSNGPLYSLLALYMPLTTLAAFVFLLQTMTDANLPSFFLIICGCLSGLAASFYCDFMKDTKSSRTAADIRGGIIITVICYICASLLRREVPFRERFLPDIKNIMSCAASLYAWIYVVSLKRLFAARMNFETYTKLYQGEKLQSALFEDSALLQYTEENIDKAQWRYFIQLVLIALLALSCSILKIHLPLSLYFLLACILTGAVCLFSFFETMKWEHYYAGEGISLTVHDRTKLIIAMILMSALCLAAAIIPASDKSILSFSLITGFFSWLLSLFRRPLHRAEEPVYRETPMSMDFPQAPFNLEDAAPSPLWETISKYIITILKYGLIVLAAAGFIRFMISPLLNRGDFPKELSFRRRLFRIIAEWFRGILIFFANLKNGGTKRKLRKYGEAEIQRTAEDLFSAYSSAKKSDMKRSVTLFARLILWGGETRHVEWKPTLAPGEYCAIRASASQPDGEPVIQNLNEGIIRCGEIFEKALYSAAVLSGEEKKEFKKLVEEITAI